MVLGLPGFDSSQVSFTDCVMKSIHRRSATERVSAARRELEVMLIVVLSKLIRMSLYRSFCCKSKEFVEPTIYDFVP